MDQIYTASAQGKQPTCTGEKDARSRARVSSSSGARIMWCFGKEGDDRVLTIVNARGYAVTVENTRGLEVLRRGNNSFATSLASWLGQAPTRRGNKVEFVDSGNSVTYRWVDRDRVQVAAIPSVSSFLFSGLNFAAETITTLLDRTGMPRTKLAILKAMDVQNCTAGYVEGATSTADNVAEVTEILRSSLSTALGCGELAIKDLGLGVIGDFLVKGYLWLTSGLKTLGDGLGGLADTVLNNAYKVTLQEKATHAERGGSDFCDDEFIWDKTVDGDSRGSYFVEEDYNSDLRVEGCGGNFALVYASRGGRPGDDYIDQEYIALRHSGGQWHVVMESGFIDTRDTVFRYDELNDALDGDIDEFLDAVGSDIESGQPIV